MTHERVKETRSTLWPHGWAVIACLALTVAPRQAVAALWTAVRGRRVRGWNLLYLLAAEHPSFYAQWVRRGEPRQIRRYCAAGTPDPVPSITCIILGNGNDADAINTMRSARRAFAPQAILTDVEALAGHGATIVSRGASLAGALDTHRMTASWLLPLAAGDTVSPVLGRVIRHARPDALLQSLVYWDEDVARGGGRLDPWIKPDWDPLLFRVRDGLTGAALVATRLACDRAGDASFDLATFDLASMRRLIASVAAAGRGDPLHIPLILTHRAEPVSVDDMDPDRLPGDMACEGLTPVTPVIWPAVTIIIPTRDRADLLAKCLSGLERLTYSGPLELLIVDNDSVEDATLGLMADAARNGARILQYPGPFNYAAMINRAVADARGDILCLLNNDIETLDGEWLTRMVRYAILDRVGAVGARLLYPGGEIQHAGIAVGIGGAAGHVQKGVLPSDREHADWHGRTRTVSAVTGACLVVSRVKFEAADGLDAEGFQVDFNDVDFCLMLRSLGLRNIVVAEAMLVHHESKTRGVARDAGAQARFAAELALLRDRWQTLDIVDPHHSPAFRRECERCVLSF